jgi:hypothetical protein
MFVLTRFLCVRFLERLAQKISLAKGKGTLTKSALPLS